MFYVDHNSLAGMGGVGAWCLLAHLLCIFQCFFVKVDVYL